MKTHLAIAWITVGAFAGFMVTANIMGRERMWDYVHGYSQGYQAGQVSERIAYGQVIKGAGICGIASYASCGGKK